MKFGTKLVVLFTVIMVGLVAFGVLSYSTMNAVKVKGATYDKIVLNKDLIADILPPPEYILESDLVVHQMMGASPEEMDELAGRLDQLKKDYDTRHEYWTENLPEGEMRRLLLEDSYRPAERFFETAENEFVPAVRSGDRAAAEALLEGPLEKDYDAHRAAIDKVVALATEDAAKIEKDATSLIGQRTAILVVTLCLVLVVGLVLLVPTIRSITRPLRKMSQVAAGIARGELDQTVDYHSSDEIGELADSFRATIESLRTSLRSIRDNSDTLAAAAAELTAVSTQMGANAEETSAQSNVVAAGGEQVSHSVSTVATAVEEMTASVAEIAKSASDAARVAANAVEEAQSTNAKIAKLDESSVEIGNVVKVITSIAEQTNLLALNATIEAARAGESGKGFAVVANEVKDLANETARATEDISRKIETIQGDTTEAVTSIGRITEIISQINDIQNTIASAVEEQAATTNEIGRNVAEAARGSQEISENISGVAQAAQSTADGVGSTQQAAEDLSRMAGELEGLVGQFHY